jgi:hypothetical protein
MRAMTEEDYAAIAAACDRSLRAPATSLARLAIPALHVVHEHPAFLAQYASLLTDHMRRAPIDIPRAILRAIRGVARSLHEPALSLATRESVDVIIVSHLSNAAQLDQVDDFYFGALQGLLQERGVSSLLVLINHLPAISGTRATQPFLSPRLLLPRSVFPAAELSIWRQCVAASRRLRAEARHAHDPLDRRVAMLASRQALSASTAINLRTHASLAAVCRAVNPKIVITTYEGDAVERLIWHAARTARRRPICVGYQHARLLKRAHAIRRAVATPSLDCDPEVVLTLGETTHATLAATPGLGPARLIEYGSHRSSPPADMPPPHHRPRRCLVLPDADDQECIALFEFALDCARQSPDIQFALRPHPIVDGRLLVQRHQILRTLPSNVRLSANTPLMQELAQARYCLYRGSSAAMHAVSAGIKPFYLAHPGELPCDALFDLTEWRETVTSPEELNARINAADGSHSCAAATRATSVCQRYVSAVRPGAIDELLAMVNQ